MNHTPAPLPKPRRIHWLWVLAVISVLAIVWGMWRALEVRHAKQAALQANTERAAANLVIPSSEWWEVQPRILVLGVAITGSLSAVESAVVKARVPGELRDFTLREGDAVKAGQVVARVDATESEARFRQAKLQADAAQAQVAIQERQLQNNQALVERGFISSTALATSQANLQAAQANYAAARAGQDGAQKTLDDTVLKSPIDGYIAQRMAQNGERVNVEAPVVEIVNLSSLELEAQIPANDATQVQVGQSAQLQLRSSQGQTSAPLLAQVVRINPSASVGNRAIPVYLRLQTQVDANANLRPGMYVEGFIATGQHNALAVPLDAVRTDQPEPYVQAVRDGTVQHVAVELGIRSAIEARTWVAVQGIPAGTVVLAGSVGAVPIHTRVQLLPAATAPSN
jgi:RND family efflux transporter MFP subunit